jgi:putative tricarboxylic transport membrane protein
MMVPGIFILSIIGAYGIANSVFDVYVLVVVGLIAYVLSKLGVPLVTMALGLVLGRLMEESFQQAALLAGVENEPVFVYFLTRPVTLFLMLMATAVLVNGLRSSARERKLASSPGDSVEPSADEAAALASELVTPVGAPARTMEPVRPARGRGASLRALNLALVVVLWAAAAFIYLGSRDFTPQAAEFPLIVVASFVALGGVIAFNNLRPTTASVAASVYPFEEVPWRDLIASIIALLVLVVAVAPLGFYEASLLYAAIGCWILLSSSSDTVLRRAVKSMVFAGLFMASVWVTFHLVLQVPTPPGLLL